MALLTWDQSFSVKVDKMDEQHQILFDMINEFYDNIGTQPQKELVLELVKKMKDYTIFHFTDEEKLMEQHNYPHLIQHKKEHGDFIEKVEEIESKFKEGKMVISVEVTNFLKNWIKNHIYHTDQKYTQYIVEL